MLLHHEQEALPGGLVTSVTELLPPDALQAKRMCTIFLNLLTGRICSNKWISENTLQQRDGVRTVKLGKNGKERRNIQVVSFFIGVSLRNFSQIHFAQARYCSTQIL